MTEIQQLAKQVEALTNLVALLAKGQTVKTQPAKPAAQTQTLSPRLASKDARILRGFKRKGIKNVVLMDRSDRSKAFNVKPFKAWLAEGRIVRKGEHGVQGLFHVSQTDKVVTEQKAATQPSTAKSDSATAESSQKPVNPNGSKPQLTLKSFQDLADATVSG